MHYTDTGAGTPVVLLHAFPLDSRMWAGIDLGAAARLITLDQRGFGRAPLHGEPDLAATAADVVELLDTLDIEQAVVGGCSMGGYVTMALLRAAPQRVRGVILVDTKCTADPLPGKENRLTMASRVEAEGVGWLAESLPAVLLGANPSPSVVAEVARLIADQSPAAIAWAQRAMAARQDSADVLRDLDVPALIVRGAEDGIISDADVATLAGLLPRSEVATLQGVGHLPSIEAPDELAAAIRRWLG